MIRIRPFRAWRPALDKAHLVGSRSFVSYTDEQLREKLAGNPFSYLHIIHADLGNDAQLSRTERFQRVRQRFDQFVGDGWMLQDEKPGIYLYEQSMDGRISRGIIAAVHVGDYRAGKVKVHEHTLQAREELFKEYLDVTGVNAEPVLLAAPDADDLDTLLASTCNERPTYDFSTTDRVRHRLWYMNDDAVQQELVDRFAAMDALYIADGHHRFASSARLAEARGAFGEHPKAWCLAFIVPEKHLHIHNFDRAISTLAGMETEEFLNELATVGTVTAMEGTPDIVPEPGHVFVCTRHGWYDLELPALPATADATECLDASRLSSAILGPVLHVHDLRTSSQVRFVPGTDGVAALERLVRSGEAAVAFHLRPVSFTELRAVADEGGCMPPKSTYIEPKLRSGITVYPLEA